jgi:hypothetical protein
VLKDIGDGSFGSVVLARVRSAGSSVARRGTVVSKYLLMTGRVSKTNCDSLLDCHQNNEEELRIVGTMFRTSGSRFPEDVT